MKKNKFRIIRPKLSDEGSDYEPSNPSPVWTIPEPSKSYEPSNGGPVWTIPKPSKSKSLPKTRLADSLPMEQNVRLTKRRELISKLEIKQEIVEEAKVVNNNAQVARKHGLSQDTIQYWCKNEDNISKYFFQIKYLSTTFFHVFCMHFINYCYTDTTLNKLRPYEVPSRRDAQSYVQMPSPSPPTLGFLEGMYLLFSVLSCNKHE